MILTRSHRTNLAFVSGAPGQASLSGSLQELPGKVELTSAQRKVDYKASGDGARASRARVAIDAPEGCWFADARLAEELGRQVGAP